MASRARLYPRLTDVERAVEAARRVGLVVNAIETRPDGTIRVSYQGEPPKDDFEKWESVL